jgi:MFS transporter, FLVCR family, MFS-domain-containing protein 7
MAKDNSDLASRDDKSQTSFAMKSMGSSTRKDGLQRLASTSSSNDLRSYGAADQVEDATVDTTSARDSDEDLGGTVYKVYKRRWFGLVQFTLLNIVVSWDVSCAGFFLCCS